MNYVRHEVWSYPKLLSLFLLLTSLLQPSSNIQALEEARAKELVHEAIMYWRGQTSEMLAQMHVHRPDWQRKSQLKSWTKGTSLSLVRFIKPKKDAGNASLTVADDMWTFSPKTNRAIKVPPSMKSQSWMGSDFSYQDLSKDDEIVEEYDHKLLSTKKVDGHLVYEIEAIPKEDAPVVWGRETLLIRDDYIILQHTFYDQDGVALKQLKTMKIGMLGGRLYPITLRMSNLEKKDEWTEVTHLSAEFNADLKESFFVVGNLRRM